MIRGMQYACVPGLARSLRRSLPHCSARDRFTAAPHTTHHRAARRCIAVHLPPLSHTWAMSKVKSTRASRRASRRASASRRPYAARRADRPAALLCRHL